MQFNHFVVVIGMVDEFFIRYLLSQLAYFDHRESELGSHFNLLKARRAVGATGVHGGFVGQRIYSHGSEVGSVYAEIAYAMGYLDADRILGKWEFEALRSGVRAKCRSRDYTIEDVFKWWGPPSWRSGENPYYPCTLLYLPADPKRAAVAFDFLGAELEEREENGVAKDEPIQMLRNVRIRSATFSRDFTFTPLGKQVAGRK